MLDYLLLSRVHLLDRETVGRQKTLQLLARDARADISQNLILVLSLVAPHRDLGSPGPQLGRKMAAARCFFESRILDFLFL